MNLDQIKQQVGEEFDTKLDAFSRAPDYHRFLEETIDKVALAVLEVAKGVLTTDPCDDHACLTCLSIREKLDSLATSLTKDV